MHAKSRILWSDCRASSCYNATNYKKPTAKIYKNLNPCTLVYSLVLESVRVTVLLETATFENQQILVGKINSHNALSAQPAPVMKIMLTDFYFVQLYGTVQTRD